MMTTDHDLTFDVFVRQERNGTFHIIGATFSKRRAEGINIYVSGPFGAVFLPGSTVVRNRPG